jgi:protein-disulfide isomerase
MHHSPLVPVACAALAFLAAMTPQSARAEEATCGIPGASASATSQGALLELAGKAVRRADLPVEVQSALHDIEREAFEKSETILKEFALRASLAREKNKGVSFAKLPPMEELMPIPEPSEARVKEFFEKNKAKIPPGTTIESVRPQIMAYLGREMAAETFNSAVDRQEKKGAFRLLAKAPEGPVVDLDLATYPTKGAPSAKVTVVEVSDYLCPHCREAYPEVKRIVAAHGSAVRFVQVNFALRPEGLSGALARGAWCARKSKGEEAFWKFHEAAFTGEHASASGDVEATLAVAKAAGLAIGDMKSCLDSKEAHASVRETHERLGRAGVNGTPTFFVNGRKEGRRSLAEAVRKAL